MEAQRTYTEVAAISVQTHSGGQANSLCIRRELTVDSQQIHCRIATNTLRISQRARCEYAVNSPWIRNEITMDSQRTRRERAADSHIELAVV